MAAYSIESLRKTQPEGPYYLGGHALGGVVAFAVAQQLRRMGQAVAVLVLVKVKAKAKRLCWANCRVLTWATLAAMC